MPVFLNGDTDFRAERLPEKSAKPGSLWCCSSTEADVIEVDEGGDELSCCERLLSLWCEGLTRMVCSEYLGDDEEADGQRVYLPELDRSSTETRIPGASLSASRA
ncbi:hypothetical protein LTR85_009006 [Meristemomyces frigidus]|nr:hypothetical protein LTR85_009006 [Meristemomyces frigidus]